MKYFIIILISFSLNNYSQTVTENSLDIVKKRVKKGIDAYAFDEDSKKRRYKVVFEGKYARLLIMKRNGSAPINKGIVFDFSNVYKFDPISKRRKNTAYLNIWIASSTKKKGFKWKKRKLIMKVFDYEHAETVMQALKDYNKILLKKK